MARRRDRLGLVVLLAVEVALVVGLHRLGTVDGLGVPWGSLPDWVRTASPEDVVAAVVRTGALALAWWLLGSTVLCVAAAGLAGAPRTARALTATTLPSVRRLVQRSIAASVVAGAAIGVRPALADPPPPSAPPSPPALVIDHRGPRPAPPTTSSTRPSSVSTPRNGRSPGLESFPDPPAPVPLPAPAPPPIGAAYVVVSGDSLWSIAATQLARLTGRAPADVPDVEVAPYWVAVVAANRDRLASGDPNLIYPGETVELPPVG